MTFHRIALQRPAAIAAGFFLVFATATAGAQAWKPEKPVELLVSSAPGAATTALPASSSRSRRRAS